MVWHVVLDADAHVIREEAVAVADGPSIHDCAITRNYALVFDLPVTFSMKSLLAGYRFPYAWNEAHPARVGLLPRAGAGSEIVWVPVDRKRVVAGKGGPYGENQVVVVTLK